MHESLQPSTAQDRYPGYRRVDLPSLSEEKAAFRERVVGQEEAIGAFANLFVKIKSGVRSVRSSPIDTKFLAGPSGVGKTELVYALAEILADDDPEARKKVLKINGGDYQPEQRHNLSRLFGAPPGYRGSEDPLHPGSGSKVIFSQKNLDSHRIFFVDHNGQQKSVILILVDEAEKADYSFHMGFLSILDKGEMDLANNDKSDFKDTVIFYTSNVGNKKVEQRDQERTIQTDMPTVFQQTVEDVVFIEDDRDLIINEFTQAFPPEFRGRIQDPIVFNHLNHEAIGKIAQLKVKEIEESFATNGIMIEIDLPPEVHTWLIRNGYSRSEGARGMDKLVKSSIMEQLLIFDAARGIDVLATGIHRKRIGLGVSEDGSGLEFYFGDGYQLPNAARIGDLVSHSVHTQIDTQEETRQSLQNNSAHVEVSDYDAMTEKAKDILEEDFLGVEAVLQMAEKLRKVGVNVEFNVDTIPAIPYSETDLQLAKRNGEMLVLRTNEMNIGNIPTPISLINFRELFKRDPNNNGQTMFYYGKDWYANSPFVAETGDIKPEWALVKKNILVDSLNKNWDQQKEILKEYGKILRRDGGLHTTIRRRTATEFVWDMMLRYTNTDTKLLPETYDWTQTRLSNGYLLYVGAFDSIGVRVFGNRPDYSYSNLGVCPSR